MGSPSAGTVDDVEEWLARVAEPEFLDILHDQSLLAKGFVRRQKPRPPADWELGEMVPWPELLPGVREDRYPMSNGKDYLVQECYCLAPDCPCEEIVLSFLELDEWGDGNEIGVARIVLPDLQITKWEILTRSEEMLTQVFQAYKERYGERLLPLLEERRRECRALGKKLASRRGSRAKKRKTKRRKKRR